MENEQLKPHCVNLPIGIISQIRNKHRTSASQFIRSAIANALSGSNAYEDGYKAGLSTASEIVLNNRWANRLLLGEHMTLANVLSEEIKGQTNDGE